MKRLEDIEYMDVEQLEAAALQEHIPIPEGLEDRIKASIAAATVAEGAAKQKPVRWIPYAAVAAAAAIAAVTLASKTLLTTPTLHTHRWKRYSRIFRTRCLSASA